MVEVQIPEIQFHKSDRQLDCGHICNGVQGESENLPCLVQDCIQFQIDICEASEQMLNCAEGELCGICFTSELSEEPCVRVSCGHIFHANCLQMLLTHRWTTKKITFGYLDCPSCKLEIFLDYEVPVLSDTLRTQLQLKEQVMKLSTETAIKEGLDKEGRVVTEGDFYYGKLAEFALHACTFYECSKCKEPYFGGMQDCAEAMQSENSDDVQAENLQCQKCVMKQMGYGQKVCAKHGYDYIDWKCMRCCSMAVFFCGGGTMTFCTPCHNDAMASRNNITSTCTGGDCCPLGIPEHPVAGTTIAACFPLGCSLCRSEKVALIQTNNEASSGVTLEDRQEMISRFNHVQGHDIGREMGAHRGRANEEEKQAAQAAQAAQEEERQQQERERAQEELRREAERQAEWEAAKERQRQRMQERAQAVKDSAGAVLSKVKNLFRSEA